MKALFACKAVVRMAFKRSIVFCFLLPPPLAAAELAAGFEEASGRLCAASGSSVGVSLSSPRFLVPSAVAVASLIGQTNPVRGVYAGRCWRRVSNEVCRDCSDVSYQ